VPAARKTFSMDHPIVITFLIFAIIGFMYAAAAVLKPLALAILLAFAIAPLSSFLERRGLPRFLAAVITVLALLGVVGFVSFKVGQQLDTLANRLPEYEQNVFKKLRGFRVGQGSGAIEKVNKFVGDVSEGISAKPDSPVRSGEPKPDPEPSKVVDVRLVNQRPNIFEETAKTVGPYLESLGVFAFVLVLVLFILNNRDDLGDRIIRLFGRGRISLTTKTTAEVGQRISRYIVTFGLVNSSVGLIVGLGLWAIGLPYALVWGVLAAMLRFVPYAGPATAFALPMAFALAQFEDWQGPLEVLALFATLEIAANSFLEPMIYGKTTGVSALGLLVAAMFWTWLWGALGLLLSTPLTVCLAVLGKYVPALKVFATFLGEEATLTPDVRFYQRLLARDQDGAATVAEEVLKEHPRATFFDEIVVPTLSMIERDFARDEIDERERDFCWWVVDEVIQDIGSSPAGEADLIPPTVDSDAATLPESGPREIPNVVAIPANDRGDLLPLRMLQVLVEPAGCQLHVLDVGETPLQVAERLAEARPTMILVSHLPPGGLASARYLVRRLRARFGDIPILVGRWALTGEGESADRLADAGASQVVCSLAEARDRILGRPSQPAKLADPKDAKKPEPIGA